jgi:hypothetical protein
MLGIVGKQVLDSPPDLWLDACLERYTATSPMALAALVTRLSAEAVFAWLCWPESAIPVLLSFRCVARINQKGSMDYRQGSQRV